MRAFAETILKSPWIYRLQRIAGLLLLIAYLAAEKDFRFSLSWMWAFPALAVAVALAFTGMKLHTRFPKLNSYFLASRKDWSATPRQTEAQWALNKSRHLLGKAKGILLVPTEDALICVPLLLVGINPASVCVAGLLFGAMHLGGYTYMECIGKCIYYAAACALVLPHGLLTVIAGHFMLDFLGLAVLLVTTTILKKKVNTEKPA